MTGARYREATARCPAEGGVGVGISGGTGTGHARGRGQSGRVVGVMSRTDRLASSWRYCPVRHSGGPSGMITVILLHTTASKD